MVFSSGSASSIASDSCSLTCSVTSSSFDEATGQRKTVRSRRADKLCYIVCRWLRDIFNLAR